MYPLFFFLGMAGILPHPYFKSGTYTYFRISMSRRAFCRDSYLIWPLDILLTLLESAGILPRFVFNMALLDISPMLLVLMAGILPHQYYNAGL